MCPAGMMTVLGDSDVLEVHFLQRMLSRPDSGAQDPLGSQEPKVYGPSQTCVLFYCPLLLLLPNQGVKWPFPCNGDAWQFSVLWDGQEEWEERDRIYECTLDTHFRTLSAF